jgi:hypothetical protein
MKKRVKECVIFSLLIFMVIEGMFGNLTAYAEAVPNITVSYHTHIQTYGNS